MQPSLSSGLSLSSATRGTVPQDYRSRVFPHTAPAEGESLLDPAGVDAFEHPAPHQQAPILAVVPGAGGAGASTLAAAVAVTAARAGDRVLLVDLDPLGGGIDLLLGLDDVTGLRWPALAHCRGRLPAASLHDSLPRAGSLAVLAWSRGEPVDVTPEAVESVLAAGRRGHDVVVADVPRALSPAAAAGVEAADELTIVVPARVPAIAAAAQFIETLPPRSGPHRAVVRRRPGDELSGRQVGDLLQIPWVVEARDDGRLATSPRGELPGLSGRSPVSRVASRLLTACTANRSE
ncbi:MAG: septum site-determining protein Ssd [Angustibacter sp.]